MKAGTGVVSMMCWLPEDSLDLAKSVQKEVLEGAESISEIDWDNIRWAGWTVAQMKKRLLQSMKQVPDYKFKKFHAIIEELLRICVQNCPDKKFLETYHDIKD